MIINPKIIKKVESNVQLPEYMSAKNFTFDGNSCTSYVGDNTLPEIIIPKSYSIVTSIETVVGAKVLDKFGIRHEIRDFESITFSDGEDNSHTYLNRSELNTLTTDFPNDCYLVSMEVRDVFEFSFLRFVDDMQILQFPININGQSFSDGRSAFDYIMQNDITNVNFGGDVELISYVDGNDYQVTSVTHTTDMFTLSGFANYQNHVILLSNITSIGDDAFVGSITAITIPDTVTSIGNGAFRCRNLRSVTIPEGVTSIGNGTFNNCSSLTGIIIPNTVTSISDDAFLGCSSLTGIIIPDSVTSIGSDAFRACKSLTSITIPASVTSIGRFAFEFCSSLESVNFATNSQLTSIGTHVFKDCTSLTSIEIPASVTSISDDAFEGCDNLQITVEEENGYYSSDNGSLYNKAQTTLIRGAGGVTTINILNTVTSIGDNAFYLNANLTSIEIPTNVTNIGNYAFGGTSLPNITIPDSVTSIGSSAFSGCSNLTSITIPDSVTSIGSFAFFGCSSLTSVIIGSGLTSIEDRAFLSCDSLTSITIPEGVTSIGDQAFDYCTSLTTMRVEATTPPILENTNAISTATTTIEVPMESVEAYKTATNWTNFANIIVGYTK